jgi:hypothetical protein
MLARSRPGQDDKKAPRQADLWMSDHPPHAGGQVEPRTRESDSSGRRPPALSSSQMTSGWWTKTGSTASATTPNTNGPGRRGPSPCHFLTKRCSALDDRHCTASVLSQRASFRRHNCIRRITDTVQTDGFASLERTRAVAGVAVRNGPRRAQQVGSISEGDEAAAESACRNLSINLLRMPILQGATRRQGEETACEVDFASEPASRTRPVCVTRAPADCTDDC